MIRSRSTSQEPPPEQSQSQQAAKKRRRDTEFQDENEDENGDCESALGLGPRKRPFVNFPVLSGCIRIPADRTFSCRTDPLVHHGRHFGRTIQAFCRIQTLIKNGLSRSVQITIGRLEQDELTPTEHREHAIYEELLKLSPGLEKRLCNGSEEDIFHVAELIQKGSAGARADDTKGLKGVVLDWITPRGQCLQPPLMRNVKTDRGFYHPQTGELLCPTNLNWNDAQTREGLRASNLIVGGDDWPLFLYQDYKYHSEDIWKGLFRSTLLISAFKHIFTSPSSVDQEPRATRSGNARIHGMKNVTVASLAYVATQVRFALSSSPTFSRTDLVTDSERFYRSVIDAFMHKGEQANVQPLLAWWDMQIFPVYNERNKNPKKGSVLALMRAQREDREGPAGPDAVGNSQA